MNISILLKNIEKKEITNNLNLIVLDTHYVFKKFFEDLIKHKNYIEDYYHEWNKLKKYVNPYELIYSPNNKENISEYRPVSRSFFKLWEIINHFKLLDNQEQKIIANIAEGPGGFIESILKYQKNNIIYSTTLYPSGTGEPSFKEVEPENCIGNAVAALTVLKE